MATWNFVHRQWRRCFEEIISRYLPYGDVNQILTSWRVVGLVRDTLDGFELFVTTRDFVFMYNTDLNLHRRAGHGVSLRKAPLWRLRLIDTHVERPDIVENVKSCG